MRGRGDLAGLTPAGFGTSEGDATATESAAACICSELRRRYAIESIPHTRGCRMRPASQYHWDNLVRSRAERHPSGLGNAQYREPRQSSAKMAVFRSNRGQPASKSSAPSADGNHENANKKQKARTNVR